VRATAIGFMSVAADQAGRTFTPDELGLAETIAADIAAAVENARLLERAKAAAAAEERNRIARELHDSVTQTMYSVSIVAEALPRLLERDLAEAKCNAAYLRKTTLGALAEMRTLLFELRPGTLDRAGLDVLLQQLADVLTGRTRVPVEITVEGEATLPPDVKIGLYRIAQEAFNNVGKHARANRAWVTLQRGPEGAILAIRDNGRGFDPESIPQERIGLRIMRERAKEIGAVLTVESGPGQGTTVSVVWTADEGR
jgi:signal transduction histidine kinase